MRLKKDYSNLSDDMLFGMIRQEDLGAFEEIYKRYWKLLFAAAYKRLKSRELSEEAVQEIFANFWEKRLEIIISESVQHYLLRSVTYYVIDYFRKEAVRMRYQTALMNVPLSYKNVTEETVMLHELQIQVSKAVDQLPAKCKKVFQMSRQDHKSNKEIAEALEISEKTVENHISKALKILRGTIQVIITLASLLHL